MGEVIHINPEQEFARWLARAKQGENFCYYTGPYISNGIMKRATYKAYEEGLVSLVQKRESGKGFAYLAQRR